MPSCLWRQVKIFLFEWCVEAIAYVPDTLLRAQTGWNGQEISSCCNPSSVRDKRVPAAWCHPWLGNTGSALAVVQESKSLALPARHLLKTQPLMRRQCETSAIQSCELACSACCLGLELIKPMKAALKLTLLNKTRIKPLPVIQTLE